MNAIPKYLLNWSVCLKKFVFRNINTYISDVVRLRGGNSAREGRVELIINEKWVAVSHYYWNRNGADVVCKQLGYVNGAEEVVTTNRYHRHRLIIIV